MIIAVNKYQCIVSLHGRNFGIRPIQSYHRGATEKFRCLGAVLNDVEVDICGSGCVAWHTDYFKLKLSDFQKPNMADIWLSKIAHEQRVKMICLEHPLGYLGYEHYEGNIYDMNNRNEIFQTELINSFLK